MLLLILFLQLAVSQEQILFNKYSSINETHIINEELIFARPFAKTYFLYSENGGKDWDLLNLGIVNYIVHSEYDGKFIWAVNNGGILLKINPFTKEVEGIDLGYFYYKNDGSHNNFVSISNQIIVVSHSNNKISLSKDYGKTWELIDIPKFEGYEAKYLKPKILDNEIYFSYQIRYNNKIKKNIMFASDGKKYMRDESEENNEWVEVTDEEIEEYRNTKPTIVVMKEMIIKSNDFGKTWEKFVEIDKNEEDKQKQFIWGIRKHKNEIWVFGISGLLTKTSDNGQTWEWFDTKTDKGIKEIIFKGEKVLLGCGYNGALVLEYDFDNVKTLYEDDYGAVNDIDIFGDELFISGGENGTILKMKYK